MTNPLSDAMATEQLDLIETRFELCPARVLGIADHASVIDACVAFATLAEIYHPRRYLTLSPQLAHRGQRVYKRLQMALSEFIASIPDRPTRELLPSKVTRTASPAGDVDR